MRWLLLIGLCLIGCFDCFADISAEIYGPAPDPGEPPRSVPLGFVIVSSVFALLAFVFLIFSFQRGKIAWETTLVASLAVLLFTIVGLSTVLMLLPPSEEYQQWQEAHRKWKNKEKVVVGYEPPPRRSRQEQERPDDGQGFGSSNN